jgi:pyruvate/2-oxoacid:ferredoxin oxidoreductase beta subunit
MSRLPRGRVLRRALADHRLLTTASPTAWTCPTTCASRTLAVNSGHWPLFRYDPVLNHTHPEDAERFLRLAQRHVETRFSLYQQLAHLAVAKQG